MSWHTGQQQGHPFGHTRPLGIMGMAAFMAANKPLMEQAALQLMREMEKVPADIDLMQFQAGVARYAAQNARPEREDYPEIARVGRMCLRDAGGEGPPVVLVPSMVNRGYILDLHPEVSLVGHLRAQGMRVLLVDWGVPQADDVLTLEQVIADGLEPMIAVAVERFGPVALFGYCMGGLLALAAAVRLNAGEDKPVSQLAVAAMPWDFAQTVSAQHMQMAKPFLEPWLQANTLVPPEVMAHYFWSLDPWGPIRRTMAYARETRDERLGQMTALEDWLGDGLALDGPVAREMLLEWYGSNTPVKGEWVVRGTPILPANIGAPLWVCITQKDILVPAASSLPFIGQAKGAQVVMADTGHVGLVAGRRSREMLYEPLTRWLIQGAG